MPGGGALDSAVMRRRICLLSPLALLLACGPTDASDGTETETSGATTTTTSTGTDTDTETETGEPDPCAAMDVAIEPCGDPTLRAWLWDGQACVQLDGCACSGADCGELYTFEDVLLGGDGPGNAARNACWSAYIEPGCMVDPCDCPAGEFCVASYDGTCRGGMPSCQTMPLGCEDDPKNCDGDCPEMICGTGNECFAPPCGGEWSESIYCYGI